MDDEVECDICGASWRGSMAETRLAQHIRDAHQDSDESETTQCSCGEWVEECYFLNCGLFECRYCDYCEPDTWTCQRDNCGNSDNCSSCDDNCTYCDRPPGIEGIY